MCLLSIITVCKNAEHEIGITLDSILTQNCDMSMVEVIIIDGLSTDYTINVIRQYDNYAKKKNLKIWLYSEKDLGIYDAMNKGAQRANGEWCLYLNAGDVFFDNNALKILDIGCLNEYDIVYGDTVHSYQNKYKKIKSRSEMEINFLHGMEFCHQSCIIRTTYLQIHPYVLSFKIAGDYEFFTRAYIEKARFHYVPGIIAIFDKNGVSSNNGGLVKKENAEIQYKYGLLNRKKYMLELRNSKIQLVLRKYIPFFIIRHRHNRIMKRSTKNWKALDEIKQLES